MQRVSMTLARGGATRALRVINSIDQVSWEFSGISHNGQSQRISTHRLKR